MVSDPDIPTPVKSHAGWKCDMLVAMAKDRKMRLVDVGIAALVLQRCNQSTKVSAITDERLSVETKRNRATFNEFRKRGKAAGYFDYIPGASGRATTYKWQDDRLDQIRNMELDQRILNSEREEDLEQETVDADDLIVRGKLTGRAAASVKRTKHSNDTVVPRKLSTSANASVEKTEHCLSAEKTEHKKPKCAENSAHSAKKTVHLHSYSSLKDSLPVEGRVSTHAREAPAATECDGWTEEDRQARFDEVAGYLEYDEGLPRHEAEHQACTICGFDDAGADGRQGAGTAPPAVAKRNPEEGIPHDQDHPYHGV